MTEFSPLGPNNSLTDMFFKNKGELFQENAETAVAPSSDTGALKL